MKIVQQEVVGREICRMLLATPEYGPMFGMAAMAWHLLNDGNKQKIIGYVQKTNAFLSSKFLILLAVAEYAPKLDLNFALPEGFGQILACFGVDPNIQPQAVVGELNSHVDFLLDFLQKNEQTSLEKLNTLGSMVATTAMQKANNMGNAMMTNVGSNMMGMFSKGGKKRRKRTRRRTRRRSNRKSNRI